MANVVARYENGPLTFEVSTAVKGGQLVHPTTGGKIGPADGSKQVLGVALYDAIPAGTSNVGTTSYGATVVDISQPQPDVAVAFKGVFKLKNGHGSTAIAFGDLVVCRANGEVEKLAAVTTPTPGDVTETREIVGQCVEPLGIVAGATGLIRLSL
jgi:hypothetical protein